MTSLKEINQIREILSNYKNLGVGYLVEEEHLHAQKVEELIADIDEKLKLIELIDEEIEELEAELEDKELLEAYDIEIIKTKTQLKKSEKKLKKLESLDLTHMKIDNTENDKIRHKRNTAKLELLKKLTDVTVDSDCKVLLGTGEGSFKTYQINKNNPVSVNRQKMWQQLEECSPYTSDWKRLLDPANRTKN